MKKFIKRIAAAAAAAAMCLSALPAASFSAAAVRTITATSDGNGTASATPTSLAPGESYTLTATPNPGYEFDHWEVTGEGGAAGTANIAFVIDISSSMDSYIKKVNENLDKFVTELSNKGITVNSGVITYGSTRTPDAFHTYANGSHWSTDVSATIDLFDDILSNSLSGGPERATEAFKFLINDDDTINFPSSINNYIFVLTDEACDEYKDADPKSSDPGKYPLSKYADIFAKNNVPVTVVAKKSCLNDGTGGAWTSNDKKVGYDDIIKKTGGRFIDIYTEDYYEVMIDYADFINGTIVRVNETYYKNPCTAVMPDCDIVAKACFKPSGVPSAYKITVVTEGRGTASASRATAAPGQQVSIAAKPESGWKLESITSSDVSISGNSFVMPAKDVTIYVRFVEDYTQYVMTGRPHSYIFSYDGGELIATNCNRKFIENSDMVVVTVKLGEKYAGKSCTLYTGKKSSGGTALEKAVLDKYGRAEFTVEAGKNFHLIVND